MREHIHRKMNIRVLIQVILITLAIHSAGYADSKDKTLWGQAEYGMTPSQILKLFPDSQPTDADTEGIPDVLVSIPSLHVSHTEFTVKFVFKDERLDMVVLRSKDTSLSEITYLTSLLIKNHGQPTKNENHNDRVKITEWDYAHENVSTFILDYATKSPRIVVFHKHPRQETMHLLL